MRVQRYIFTLAAAATLASSAPAYGFAARAPEGPSVIPTATPAQSHSADTADWLIGAGAAGALALGGGLVVRRRSSLATQPQLGATPASRATRTH